MVLGDFIYCTVSKDAIYYAKIDLLARSSELRFTLLPWPCPKPPEKVLFGGIFPDVSTIFFFIAEEGQPLYTSVFLKQQQLEASSPSLDESSSEIKFTVEDRTNGIVHRFYPVTSSSFLPVERSSCAKDVKNYLHLFPDPERTFRFDLLQRQGSSEFETVWIRNWPKMTVYVDVCLAFLTGTKNDGDDDPIVGQVLLEYDYDKKKQQIMMVWILLMALR